MKWEKHTDIVTFASVTTRYVMRVGRIVTHIAGQTADYTRVAVKGAVFLSYLHQKRKKHDGTKDYYRAI